MRALFIIGTKNKSPCCHITTAVNRTRSRYGGHQISVETRNVCRFQIFEGKTPLKWFQICRSVERR